MCSAALHIRYLTLGVLRLDGALELSRSDFLWIEPCKNARSKSGVGQFCLTYATVNIWTCPLLSPPFIPPSLSCYAATPIQHAFRRTRPKLKLEDLTPSRSFKVRNFKICASGFSGTTLFEEYRGPCVIRI